MERKERNNRIAQLQQKLELLEMLIASRDMKDLPGGATGLLCKDYKQRWSRAKRRVPVAGVEQPRTSGSKPLFEARVWSRVESMEEEHRVHHREPRGPRRAQSAPDDESGPC